MNGGRVAGGKLFPGLELQQLSSKGPPLPALTSQTFTTWPTGSAQPLKLGFAVNAVKLPPVTWFVQEWPQKFTSCPSCNPPLLPPQTTNEVGRYTVTGTEVREALYKLSPAKETCNAV